MKRQRRPGGRHRIGGQGLGIGDELQFANRDFGVSFESLPQLGPGVEIRFRRAGEWMIRLVFQTLPQAFGCRGGLLRLIDNDKRIFGEREERMLARPDQRHGEFPSRKWIAGAGDIHLIG